MLTSGDTPTRSTILDPAIEISENPFEKAAMLVALAEAQLALGETEAAGDAAEQALELSQHESIQYLAARLLMAAGRAETADEIALELENKLQSQTTALSALIRGETGARQGPARDRNARVPLRPRGVRLLVRPLPDGPRLSSRPGTSPRPSTSSITASAARARSPTSSWSTARPCATSRPPSTGSAAARRPSATRRPPAISTTSSSPCAARPIRRMRWRPMPRNASAADPLFCGAGVSPAHRMTMVRRLGISGGPVEFDVQPGRPQHNAAPRKKRRRECGAFPFVSCGSDHLRRIR